MPEPLHGLCNPILDNGRRGRNYGSRKSGRLGGGRKSLRYGKAMTAITSVGIFSGTFQSHPP